MVKITLEIDGTIRDFEESLGQDEHFDIYDSIVWQLEYGDKKDNVGHHNDIKITVDEDTYDDEDDEDMELVGIYGNKNQIETLYKGETLEFLGYDYEHTLIQYENAY